MKINSDLLIDSKVNGIFYANDFKCKNLFNINSHRGHSNATSTINGNSITITGTASYSRAVYSSLNNLETGKTYIISFSFSNPYGNSIRVGFYSGNSELIKTSGEFTDLSGRKNFTFIAQDGMNLRFYSNTTGTKNTNPVEFYDIQIELGIEETKYVTYKAFENEEVYSTSEQRIGTWINGEPLYRKVFTATPTAINSWTYITHNISNLGKVVNIYGSTQGQYGQIPLNGSDTSNISFIIQTRNIAFKTSDTDIIDKEWTIILEYTKTTD